MQRLTKQREVDITESINWQHLEDVIPFLQSILDKHPLAALEVNAVDGYSSVFYTWAELETDEEYNIRLSREASYKIGRRKQYEVLKKEFENETVEDFS